MSTAVTSIGPATLQTIADLKKLTGQLQQAGAAAESLRARLDLATGGKGAQEMAYVTALADRLGLQLESTGQAYADFLTKARGTALEGEPVRALFTGIAKANVAMHLSAEQSSASLAGVLDLMGRGAISVADFNEKLTRIPASAQIGAQALGVTKDRFTAMLQAGQVLADDFLPRFAVALQQTLGNSAERTADRVGAGATRMENAWGKFKAAVGDSGVNRVISVGMNGIAYDMNAVSEAMSRARDNGSGFFGQVNQGLAILMGRAVGLNYVSMAFQSNGERAAYLAKELPKAAAELEALQARGAATSENIYLRSSYFDLLKYVAKLKQAQQEQLALEGRRDTGGGRGFINPPFAGPATPSEVIPRTWEEPPRVKAAPVGKATILRPSQGAGKSSGQDLESLDFAKAAADLEKLIETHESKARAIQENIRLAQRETEEIGLTGAALEELRQKRVEEAASQLEAQAMVMQGIDLSGRATQALLEEAKAIRDQAKVKGYNESARMVAEYAKNVQVANDEVQFEQSLAAMSQRDRTIAIEQLKIELDLQIKLAEINARNRADPEEARRLREEATATANQAKANVAERTRVKETQASVDQMDEMFRKGFTDMLANGTEGWRTFTKNLSATFKASVADEMYKAFARPFIVPVLAQVRGMLGNVTANLGVGGSGAANGGGFLSQAGSASGVLGLGGGTFGMGLNAGVAGIFGEAGILGTLDAGITALGAGNLLGGLGTLMGAASPFVLGAIAISSLFGGFGSRGPNHAGAAYSTAGVGNDKAAEQLFGRAAGDWYDDLTQRHSDAVEKQLKTSLDGLASVYGALSKYATGSARGIDLVGGFAVNGRYSDEDAYGYAKIIDKTTGMILAGFENRSLGNNPEEAYKAFLGQTGSLLVSELKKADLPSWMRTTLDSLGEAPNVEALQAAFQAIDLIGRSFDELGKKITGFADLTDLAFESLIKASGGIEALNANAGSFYQNFYSEDERKTIAKREMGSKLKDLGVDIDLDADDAQARFRKLVEDKLKAANSEEANAKVLKDAISKVQGTQGLKDMAKTGAFKDWASSTLGEGSGDTGKLAADLENLANTSTSLADFTAGMDKLIGNIGGTGKSSAETAAELLKLNDTFKAVTKTSEDAAAASAKQAEEAKRKQEEQAQEARKKNEADTDAAWSLLQRSVDAERSAIQARIDVAQERVDTERALMETLRGHVVELRGQIESTQAMALARANEVIDQALAAYRRTGYLPESADIGEAVSVARGGISSGNFRSRLDYEAAQLILANKLEVLHDAAGEQLSADELILEQEKSQVDALERLLKTEKEALDIARGIDTRLLSSDLAWAEFRAALLKEGADTGGGAGSGESGSGGGSGGADFGPGPGPGSGGGSSTVHSKYKMPVAVLGDGFAIYDYETDPERVKKLDALSPTFHKYDGTGDLVGLANDIKAQGGTALDLAYLYGYSERDVLAALDQFGIPRFASGGEHFGGLRLVGENGPELEVTGPSRIHSAQQTRRLLEGMQGGDLHRALESLQRLTYDLGRQQIVLLQSLEKMARKSDAIGVKQRETA
ncbi:tape measure protein [Delftia sp. SD018]|uniref:tape measure protein n=1 Tax=unclassified Delftia TaxID=2613839 RepID=UPI001A97B101|nr:MULTISPECIES: tape measure protein [unclassified Delftia]MBO0990437.1 tape measure protein [Delftia sp. SD083]MBO1033478.1 tape measure protein [Delftia sp. SD018]